MLKIGLLNQINNILKICCNLITMIIKIIAKVPIIPIKFLKNIVSLINNMLTVYDECLIHL